MRLHWRKAHASWTEAQLRDKLVLATIAGRLRVVVRFQGLDPQTQYTLRGKALVDAERWCAKSLQPGTYSLEVVDEDAGRARVELMYTTFVVAQGGDEVARKTGDPFIDEVYAGIETVDLADENGEYPEVFQCPKCGSLIAVDAAERSQEGFVCICGACTHCWVPDEV